MRICRFLADGNVRFGSIEGNRVVSIESPFDGAGEAGLAYDLPSVKLLAPVKPGKILCIGLNYRDHAEECGYEIPEAPVVFMKPSTAVIGPEEAIVYPSMSHRVDYEAELAIVIGRRCHAVSEEEAASCILGYTCANDVSARDLQPHDGQWIIAKGFDTFLPIGPCIVDDFDSSHGHIECRLNGKVKQSSDIKHLIFPPAFLVRYLSSVMTLEPGDVIITGTPGGISGMNCGDIVEVEIEGLGVLRNHVV